MRILGIETSSRRGSVALTDADEAVNVRCHEEANAHGEQMLRLVDEVFADAGWAPSSLDRIAVGTGPGSFTGLRVGIALAQGIALGLDRPIVGVGSLRSMAHAVPPCGAETRIPVLDARRAELFVAVYDASGKELAEPRTVTCEDALDEVRRLHASVADRQGWPSRTVLVGAIASDFAPAASVLRSERSDLPHAIDAALLGAIVPESSVADAQYVRPADAIRPNLPPSPLS